MGNKMAEFFSMGGYDFYVWGSYGLTALCMVVEIILVKRRNRTILQRLNRIKKVTAKGE